MSEKTKNSGDLVDLAYRLNHWRRRHGGRGRRIPEELWLEAAEAARAGGVDVVARELRLRPGRLEKLVERLGQGSTRVERSAEFLEIQLPIAPIPAGPEGRPNGAAIVMWLEASDGRRLRLEVPAGARCNANAIFAAFREGTP